MDDALDLAIAVFRERGYHATSMTDLVDHMQLARGSLYKAFKDKRAIFLAAYDRYSDTRSAKLNEVVAHASSARERLQAVFTRYAELASSDDGRKGCLVVATATELTTVDAEIAARVNHSLQQLHTLLLNLVKDGQQDGSVTPHANAHAIANTMLCLLQGMRIIGKNGTTPNDMANVTTQAMRLLD